MADKNGFTLGPAAVFPSRETTVGVCRETLTYDISGVKSRLGSWPRAVLCTYGLTSSPVRSRCPAA
jgi:hypothetical protein